MSNSWCVLDNALDSNTDSSSYEKLEISDDSNDNDRNDQVERDQASDETDSDIVCLDAPSDSSRDVNCFSSSSTTSSFAMINFRFDAPPPRTTYMRRRIVNPINNIESDDDLPSDVDDRCESDISGVATSEDEEARPHEIVFVGEKRRIYKHFPNSTLNTILTHIALAALFTAMGTGIGHWIGSAACIKLRSERLVQLKNLQDDLLLCFHEQKRLDSQVLKSKDIAALWRDAYEELLVERSNKRRTKQDAELDVLKNRVQTLEKEKDNFKIKANELEIDNSELRNIVGKMRYSPPFIKNSNDSDIEDVKAETIHDFKQEETGESINRQRHIWRNHKAPIPSSSSKFEEKFVRYPKHSSSKDGVKLHQNIDLERVLDELTDVTAPADVRRIATKAKRLLIRIDKLSELGDEDEDELNDIADEMENLFEEADDGDEEPRRVLAWLSCQKRWWFSRLRYNERRPWESCLENLNALLRKKPDPKSRTKEEGLFNSEQDVTNWMLKRAQFRGDARIGIESHWSFLRAVGRSYLRELN
ncbi:DgyrCDS13783 [Dimorphilus gyrociliatus]|uniref:DgyrCDS13783 n=1 Tax=Dimorphilus gyrociliatus TaxID=2664684 RepID=A0A7I8WBR3_9ANNE|nr:DgyrCDS13783 [Dimorphilus gyrociliatus]